MVVYHQQHIRSRLVRGALVVALALSALSVSVSQAEHNLDNTYGDLGDAPDSSNHNGVGMRAYPTVAARFPTVFDPGLGAPQGPLHRQPKGDAWLGADVSREHDADLAPDADGMTNIDPAIDSPDRDRLDDGVFSPSQPSLNLPWCQQTNFQYVIRVAPGAAQAQRYTNVWFDYNQDGDWQDSFMCGNNLVSEWAVQNQMTALGAGTHVVTTPWFASAAQPGSMWMRITLSQNLAPQPNEELADGRGPGGGYTYGETEDYILSSNGGEWHPAD